MERQTYVEISQKIPFIFVFNQIKRNTRAVIYVRGRKQCHLQRSNFGDSKQNKMISFGGCCFFLIFLFQWKWWSSSTNSNTRKFLQNFLFRDENVWRKSRVKFNSLHFSQRWGNSFTLSIIWLANLEIILYHHQVIVVVSLGCACSVFVQFRFVVHQLISMQTCDLLNHSHSLIRFVLFFFLSSNFVCLRPQSIALHRTHCICWLTNRANDIKYIKTINGPVFWFELEMWQQQFVQDSVQPENKLAPIEWDATRHVLSISLNQSRASFLFLFFLSSFFTVQ